MRLEAETWVDPELINYARENLVAYHLNVDSAANKEFSNKYNIRFIPSFVFVDEEGNEIDRIVGFMPPDEYLEEIKRIRNGVNTIPDLSSRLEEDPDNAELLVQLATKLENASGLEAAMSYWEILFKRDDIEAETKSLARLKLALYYSQENEDPEALESFVNEETNTAVLPEAFDALRSFYKSAGDTLMEAATYQRYVDFMSGLDKTSPSLLNGYAWRMTQLNQNLDNALERVNQAIVALTDEDGRNRERAQILDTKGEVLWKLGRIDEAVAIMDECILLQPEDEYYQKQKAKFLESK